MKPLRAPRRVPRRGLRDDAAVAGVVTAILVMAAVVSFLAVVKLSWLPVWAEDLEARHSEDVRDAFAGWADTAEDHVARGLDGRTFTRTIPVGTAASVIPLVGNLGGTAGTVALSPTPTLTVTQGGAARASASGALGVALAPSRFEAQTYRHVLGALEVNQTDASWVDLRSVLSVSRAANDRVSLTVQALTLGGGTQSAGTTGDVVVSATVASTGTATWPTGTVRIVAEGVAGDAWRAAAKRTLNGAGLGFQSLADCAAATQKGCFDTDTNDVDTMDLTLRDVAANWRTVTGSLTVEVRP